VLNSLLYSGEIITEAGTPLTLVDYNDWGSGHQATFSYVVKESDLDADANFAWRVEMNYSGTVSSGWANGYSGGMESGNDSQYNGFYFTNENQGFKPVLTGWQELQFTVQVNGTGYNASDYAPLFFNLADAPSPSQLPGNASFTNVNDWGSGFNATLNYELTAADLESANNAPWTLTLDYAGAGTVGNSWVSGYNGSVNTQVNGNSVVSSTVGVGYRPTLQVGDVISLSVTVNGAAFAEGDFEVSFAQ